MIPWNTTMMALYSASSQEVLRSYFLQNAIITRFFLFFRIFRHSKDPKQSICRPSYVMNRLSDHFFRKEIQKYTTRNSLVGTSSRYLILSTKYTSRLSESMPNLKEISELISDFKTIQTLHVLVTCVRGRK